MARRSHREDNRLPIPGGNWSLGAGARIAAGLGYVLFGAVVLLYVYAHAAMVPREMDADTRRAKIAERMLLQPGMAGATYMGLAIVAGGVWLVVGRPWLGGTEPGERGAAAGRLPVGDP